MSGCVERRVRLRLVWCQSRVRVPWHSSDGHCSGVRRPANSVMAPFRRPLSRPRSNAMVLAGLLVCTLALAGLLAHEAQLAAMSRRATAERALQDYAAVAAWELVAGVTDQMQGAIGGSLARVTRARAVSPYELLPGP